MVIFPDPPQKEYKDIFAFISREQETETHIHHCDKKLMKGLTLWSVWTSWPKDNPENKIRYIKLFTLKHGPDGFGYEEYSNEKDFEPINCCQSFLSDTQESPFKDEQWRSKVVAKFSSKVPPFWKRCRKHYNRLKKKNNDKTIRLIFKGLKCRITGEDIPFADIETTYPLLARYQGKLYAIQTEAIIDYEIVGIPKHPKGLTNDTQRTSA